MRLLRNEPGNPGKHRKNGAARMVDGLHGALPRFARGRVMVHGAHQPFAMTTRAFGRVRRHRIARLRHEYERHYPDLKEEPERGDRGQHASQLGHLIKR